MLSERIARNAWAHASMQALFREACRFHPDKAAIIYRGERIRYGRLQARVDRLTQALMAAGVGVGDVVSTLPSPTPDFAVVFLAALQAGATINPLNLMWERDVLAAILGRNKPRVLVTVGRYGKRDYLELLQRCFGQAVTDNAAAPAARPQCTLVATDVTEVADLPPGFTRLSDFQASATDVDLAAIEARVRTFDPLQHQFICQTSGSTGLPKSALWAHRTPLSTAHFLAVHLGLSEQDRWINLSPFFHNSGMCCTLAMGLAYAGITLHLSERFNPDEAVATIQDEGIEATFGFSAHWVAMRASKLW
ncbi:MAG TPA: class I adenylate-forming enzyme family protein, partial [Nevskiaceae bacterium]|nr:class I adenylate-forming enzyme family protein [Nevskiaceae bacterium]